MRDLLARYRDPHLQRTTLYLQKFFCQNLVMGQSYVPCKIFLPAFYSFACLGWPYPRQNPMQGPQAPAWQASPWGHSPSSSAPCMVPMRLSRIDQHIKDEPCAKQRALLGVFSSRFSSVSRKEKLELINKFHWFLPNLTALGQNTEMPPA